MGKTHTNPFTQEQMDHLRVNHYVKSISRSTIRFTEEFEKYFPRIAIASCNSGKSFIFLYAPAPAEHHIPAS